MVNRRRLFIASCVSLVANAMAFSICTDIMGDFEHAFKLTKALTGQAVGAGALGAVVAIVVGGAVLDFLGIGTAMWLAFAAHVCGISLVIFATGFWSLLFGWVSLGIAGGLIEAAINPLAATTYPDNKTHVLNVLHAWWPGGLIIGGLMGAGLSGLLELTGASPRLVDMSWQIKMGFVFLPVLLYGGLMLGQEFPKTERVQAGVSTRAMFREALRPLFLVLLFCMLLTASTELGPARWVGVFIKDIIGIRGVLFLVYTSGLMFVLRFFAGPLARRFSPIGLMLLSSVVAALGLLWLSHAGHWATVFLAATVFGIGVTYYWPTMLGVTSERFPKGGALLLGLVGGAGNLFIGLVTFPAMGALHDRYSRETLSPAVRQQVVIEGRVDDDRVGALPEQDRATVAQARRHAAAVTFRWVALLPAVLTLVFGAIFLHDVARGGYRQETLTSPGGAEPGGEPS